MGAPLVVVCLFAVLLVASSARSAPTPGLGRPDLPLSYRSRTVSPACRHPGPLHTENANRVVVHYARKGSNAVPRRDADQTGVPDYVECIGAAAGRALDVFRREGYRDPKPDRTGGNQLPDVYLVARVGDGALGKTRYDTSGRAYVVLSTKLDPRFSGNVLVPTKQRRPLLGLWFTTAHELFHVIQDAYLPVGKIPEWIKEGTAQHEMLTAIYDGRWPSDLPSQSDVWLRISWRALYSRDSSCDECYGAEDFWIQYASRVPLVKVLERFASWNYDRRRIGSGSPALLDEVLRAADLSVDVVLLAMADEIHQAGGLRVGSWPRYPVPPAGLAPATRTVTSFSGKAEGLSAARIPIPVDPATRGSLLTVTIRSPSPLLLPLVYYGGPDGRRLSPSDHDAAAGIWTYRVSTGLDGPECVVPDITGLLTGLRTCRVGDVDLVPLNTTNRAAPYEVTYALQGT